MKTPLIPALLGLILIQATAQSEDTNNAPAASGEILQAIQPLLDQINAFGSLTYELAAEKHAVNSNHHEIWIITFHKGGSARKYSDGRFTLLSLPVLAEKEKSAICLFATHYNSFNLAVSDELVTAGNYKDARDLLRLTRHFDRCGDASLSDMVERKLSHLEKLMRGDEPDKNLKDFLELKEEHGTTFELGIPGKVPIVKTNDLFGVCLP
jgi:hypothetical protein